MSHLMYHENEKYGRVKTKKKTFKIVKDKNTGAYKCPKKGCLKRKFYNIGEIRRHLTYHNKEEKRRIKRFDS